MRISIVTISFNQKDFLERAILSVLEQSYSNIEYIVVDPGSTDGSRDIIEKYRDRISTILYEPDKGPADGLNHGFAHATGDIYGYINADDIILPGTLEKVAAFFQSHPDTDVVIGDGFVVDPAGNVLKYVRSTRFTPWWFVHGGVLALQQSTFFRQEAFKATEGFNIHNKTSWDAELLLDMSLAGKKLVCEHQNWSLFTYHENSITVSQRLADESKKTHARYFRKVMGCEPGTIDKIFKKYGKYHKFLIDPVGLVKKFFPPQCEWPQRNTAMQPDASTNDSKDYLYATPTDADHFFGFHDLCPWNENGDQVVLLRTKEDISDRLPTSDDVAEVCIWHPETGDVCPIGETTTWNWQQGAREQWRPGHPNVILYNCCRDGAMVSIAYNTESKEEKVFSRPVYALAPDGRHALTFNFSRLHETWPAYGYDGPAYGNMTDVAPEDEGLFLMDLENDTTTLLISLKDLATFKGSKLSEASKHFVSHVAYSPSGKKFSFFHRLFTQDGNLYTRFFVADSDGRNLQLISQEKATHYDWYDDNSILVWTRFLPQSVSKARGGGLLANPLIKPLLNIVRKWRPGLKQRLWKEGYHLLGTDGSGKRELIGYGVLDADGHPMFSNDRKLLLTDTYPDERRIMSLIIYDMNQKTRRDVAKIHSPDKFLWDLKCDLHPRWNRDCTQICVDCPESGKRQVRIYSAL